VLQPRGSSFLLAVMYPCTSVFTLKTQHAAKVQNQVQQNPLTRLMILNLPFGHLQGVQISEGSGP
jgi:hypothetical protein